MEEALVHFKEIFWDAFHKPALKTVKFQKLWERLEHINSLLAGPFYSILNNGNCTYVFEDKTRFPGIDKPEDFFNRCIELTEKYKAEILKATTEGEEESEDKKVLLFQTDIKMELSETAFQLICQQWK